MKKTFFNSYLLDYFCLKRRALSKVQKYFYCFRKVQQCIADISSQNVFSEQQMLQIVLFLPNAVRNESVISDRLSFMVAVLTTTTAKFKMFI